MAATAYVLVCSGGLEGRCEVRSTGRPSSPPEFPTLPYPLCDEVRWDQMLSGGQLRRFKTKAQEKTAHMAIRVKEKGQNQSRCPGTSD